MRLHRHIMKQNGTGHSTNKKGRRAVEYNETVEIRDENIAFNTHKEGKHQEEINLQYLFSIGSQHMED